MSEADSVFQRSQHSDPQQTQVAEPKQLAVKLGLELHIAKSTFPLEVSSNKLLNLRELITRNYPTETVNEVMTFLRSMLY